MNGNKKNISDLEYFQSGQSFLPSPPTEAKTMGEKGREDLYGETLRRLTYDVPSEAASQMVMPERVPITTWRKEQPELDPLSAKMLTGEYARSQAALREAARGKMGIGEEVAKTYEEQLRNLFQEQKSYNERYKQLEETRKKAELGVSETKKEYEKLKLDPDRYMKRMSSTKKVLLGIADALSSAMRGFTGQPGSSEILKTLDENIEKDIIDQKQNIKNHLELLNLSKEQENKIWNRMTEVADKQRKTAYQISQLMIDKYAQQAKTIDERVELEKANAAFTDKIAEIKEKEVPKKVVTGTTELVMPKILEAKGKGIDPKKIDKTEEKLHDSMKYIKIIDKAINKMEELGFGVAGRHIPTSEANKIKKTVLTTLGVMRAKDLLGQLTDTDLEIGMGTVQDWSMGEDFIIKNIKEYKSTAVNELANRIVLNREQGASGKQLKPLVDFFRKGVPDMASGALIRAMRSPEEFEKKKKIKEREME